MTNNKTAKKLSARKPKPSTPSSAEIDGALGGKDDGDELKKLWIQMPKSKIAKAKMAAYDRDKSVSKLVEEVFSEWLEANVKG